ncbi:MAG: radical SAM/SPASM domain-containing protein [Planctomycetota bacterium]
MCNLKCPMCPVGTGSTKRDKGFMSDDIWQLVLRECVAQSCPIRFVRWGEPTMHAGLYDYIGQAHRQGLLTHLTTNGEKLDIGVIETGLDSLKISLHKAPDARLLRFLHMIMKDQGRPYITVTKYSEYKGIAIPADDIRTDTLKNLKRPPAEYIPCPEIFSKLSVNWDGTVSACCGDYDNLMVVGDMRTESLASIWKGDRLKHYRKMLKAGKHAELPLCRSCCRESYR